MGQAMAGCELIGQFIVAIVKGAPGKAQARFGPVFRPPQPTGTRALGQQQLGRAVALARAQAPFEPGLGQPGPVTLV